MFGFSIILLQKKASGLFWRVKSLNCVKFCISHDFKHINRYIPY